MRSWWVINGGGEEPQMPLTMNDFKPFLLILQSAHNDCISN